MSRAKGPRKPSKRTPRALASASGREELGRFTSISDQPRVGSEGSARSEDARSFVEFETTAHTEVGLPADAHVIGEPVTVTQIRYPGLSRVGLLATCRRGDSAYDVTLADVVFPPGSAGALLIARYREWLGFPVSGGAASEAARPHKVASDDIAIGGPVELVVLACKSNALRCRLLGTAREVTLRTAVRDEVPGSIITVTPTKQWTHARHPYLSGSIVSTRSDVRRARPHAAGVARARRVGPRRGVLGRGRRAHRRLGQAHHRARQATDVRDGAGHPRRRPGGLRLRSHPRCEPSCDAAGDVRGAYELLMKLLAKDLRCLDAHAHLGNLAFDRRPKQALAPLRDGRGHRRARPRQGLRRRAPVGPHRQPAVPPLPARRRSLRVAARRCPRGDGGLHARCCG